MEEARISLRVHFPVHHWTGSGLRSPTFPMAQLGTVLEVWRKLQEAWDGEGRSKACDRVQLFQTLVWICRFPGTLCTSISGPAPVQRRERQAGGHLLPAQPPNRGTCLGEEGRSKSQQTAREAYCV